MLNLSKFQVRTETVSEIDIETDAVEQILTFSSAKVGCLRDLPQAVNVIRDFNITRVKT